MSHMIWEALAEESHPTREDLEFNKPESITNHLDRETEEDREVNMELEL